MIEPKTIGLLLGHGAPPSDFPKRELMEYFTLHLQAEAQVLPQHGYVLGLL